jgi:hypothetical protein
MEDILSQAASFYKTNPGKVTDPPITEGGDLLAYAGKVFKVMPQSKVTSRGQANTGSFQGDSQYDTNLAYGVDQGKLRARNQPWYDSWANQVTKTVPGVALGIVENIGYLGELFDDTHDYNNAITEFAKRNRQSLNEALPNYRENPDQVFDLGDSAWWLEHGQGLVESVGEFLVTGAGVGGALGKSAKGLASVIKAGNWRQQN